MLTEENERWENADDADTDGIAGDDALPALEDDGHRLGSQARRGVDCIGFVPAPTRPTLLELAWLQASAEARLDGIDLPSVPPHAFTRADGTAVSDARNRLSGMVAGQIRKARKARRERLGDVAGQLPLGSPTPIDFITKDFNTRPLIPWHQTSTGRAGVLTTFVAGSGAPVIPGPPVGLDVFSRELFTFDCWGTYDAGLTTSPDIFTSGLRGQGKSFCMKTLAVREMGYGRHVIVQSDRQGEWVRIARDIPGGQVVSPGAGNYLNPFAMPDASHLTGGEEREAFRQEVLAGRKGAVMALAEAVRERDRPFPLDKDMLSLIDQLIASYDIGPMTLEGAVDRLSDWRWVDSVYANIRGFEHYRDLAREKASEAARVFAPMVHGGTMSGMFDRESTITLDPTAPIIVFDTSGPVFHGSHIETRVHGRGKLVDRPSAAGARRIAPHHRVRGGMGPAEQPAAGRLVTDQATFRRPLGLRHMADRARRRGHDAGVRPGIRPARQGRTADEPDGNEDHLPSGRREHSTAQPAGSRSE